MEELSVEEFKVINIIIFKQLKEYLNVMEKNQNKEANEVRKSIKDMKIELNKEIELLDNK